MPTYQAHRLGGASVCRLSQASRTAQGSVLAEVTVTARGVATIRPDGTGLHHLTSYSGGHYGVFAGSYSPDGRWIVLRFEDHVAGTFALFRMRPDGSHLKEIAFLGELKPRLSDWGARPEGDSDADR